MMSKKIIALYPLPGDRIQDAIYEAWQKLLYQDPENNFDEAQFEFNGHIVTVKVTKI